MERLHRLAGWRLTDLALISHLPAQISPSGRQYTMTSCSSVLVSRPPHCLDTCRISRAQLYLGRGGWQRWRQLIRYGLVVFGGRAAARGIVTRCTKGAVPSARSGGHRSGLVWSRLQCLSLVSSPPCSLVERELPGFRGHALQEARCCRPKHQRFLRHH